MVLTNVLGPALLVRFALPHLRQTRGRIVFVGSVAGHVGIACHERSGVLAREPRTSLLVV